MFSNSVPKDYNGRPGGVPQSNAHLISGTTISTKSFTNFDIVLK